MPDPDDPDSFTEASFGVASRRGGWMLQVTVHDSQRSLELEEEAYACFVGVDDLAGDEEEYDYADDGDGWDESDALYEEDYDEAPPSEDLSPRCEELLANDLLWDTGRLAAALSNFAPY